MCYLPPPWRKSTQTFQRLCVLVKNGYSKVHSLVWVQQQYTYIMSVLYVCHLFCTILRHLLQSYIRGGFQRVRSSSFLLNTDCSFSVYYVSDHHESWHCVAPISSNLCSRAFCCFSLQFWTIFCFIHLSPYATGWHFTDIKPQFKPPRANVMVISHVVIDRRTTQ